MDQIEDPLVAAPPDEIPLANAPLVRVIAQVRFPQILSIEQRQFVAPFQEALRQEYPILRREQSQSALIGNSGVSSEPMPVVWRLSDISEAWRVSLSLGFLSLETTHYHSRSDFLGRFRVLLEALQRCIGPKVIERLGVRYIDRITGEALDELPNLVRPELLGVLGNSMSGRVSHSLTESFFQMPEYRLLARWGALPSGATADPIAIEPVGERSWILDLDMSSPDVRPFDVKAVLEECEMFAVRAYTFFRWAVTDAFLERYRGSLS